MAVGMRPKLGNTLQSIVAGDQPFPMPQMGFPQQMPPQMPGMDPAMEVKPRSKGQMIAGIIGDTLASISGGQPLYTQSVLRDRQQAQQDQREDVQWTRRRDIANQDRRADREWEIANRAPNEFDRLLEATGVAKGTPEYGKAAKQRLDNMLDPVVNTMIGDQFVSLPRSQIAAAMMGQGAQPAKPRRLGPVVDTKPGGAVSSAPRPFVEAPSGYAPPTALKSGRMTSGRRTPEGNAAVGGVAGSAHLSGRAADYWGADLGAVLREAQGLPGVRKAFIHGSGGKRHVHTEGDWNTPYFGRNGTKGR